MQFHVIGSGSSGNSYLLKSSSGQILIIECGVQYKKIMAALDHQSKGVSCIVSHSHGDHCKAIKDILGYGIPVYANKHTLQAKNIYDHYRATCMEPNSIYKISEFEVIAFPVQHDVPCYGFLIRHPECGTVVFLTDTCHSKYHFPGANQFIVEANHELTSVEPTSSMPEWINERIRRSHMDVNTTIELLKANDLSQVNNIVLIHLSKTNANAREFQQRVKAATGKEVTVADPGITISNFNLSPI